MSNAKKLTAIMARHMPKMKTLVDGAIDGNLALVEAVEVSTLVCAYYSVPGTEDMDFLPLAMIDDDMIDKYRLTLPNTKIVDGNGDDAPNTKELDPTLN